MYVVTTSVIEWHIAPAFEYKPFTYLAIIWTNGIAVALFQPLLIKTLFADANLLNG